MGDSWLANASLGYDIANTQPLATQKPHNMLPGIIGHGLGESNRIHFELIRSPGSHNKLTIIYMRIDYTFGEEIGQTPEV